MREHKFRYVWKHADGLSLEIVTLDQLGSDLWHPFFEAILIARDQFTGLKDKNGNDIYEGDIVRCANGHVGEIEWEAYDCCFNVTDYYDASDDYPSMAFMQGQPFEVIGNIYEDSELLEGEE